MFYLHSRLLERCAKLSDELGAGSMTGLPIVETKANDVSAYIPTNVISITDGQIFLQSDLFASNQRPAIDVGVSVSRVGGAAMTKAMKKVTGSLKVDLAQFRAMEAFAMFASDLDAASRQQLDRGQRLMALLRQPSLSPYPVEEMTASLWTGTTGRLDRVPTDDVLRFESEFLDYLRHSHEGVLSTIRESMDFTDDTAHALEEAYNSFLDDVRDLRGRVDQARQGDARGARGRGRRAGADRQAEAGLTMAVSLREYRARIKSTESMKKITRAMELIAASRIVKAQNRAQAAAPYARELTRAVSAVATFSNVEHALTTEPEDPKRAAILIVTSDRGLAGAYSSSVLKESERLVEKLKSEGKEVETYVSGRKGVGYLNFRRREVVRSWTGYSDQPEYDAAREIGNALITAFMAGEDNPDIELPEGARDVDEVHVVYTRFRSMLSQEPTAVRLLPLEIVEGEERPGEAEVLPLYEFEPSAAEVLDALLPRYVTEPDLLRAAAGRGLRAGRPAARDEVGDGQRRRADQEVHPNRQPGPTGRDHPGNQRDRRWRQRAGRRQRGERVKQ